MAATQIWSDNVIAEFVDLFVIVAINTRGLLPPVSELAVVIVCILLVQIFVVPLDVKINEGHSWCSTSLEEFKHHTRVFPHLLEQVAILEGIYALVDLLLSLNLLRKLHVLKAPSEVGLFWFHFIFASLQIREQFGLYLLTRLAPLMYRLLTSQLAKGFLTTQFIDWLGRRVHVHLNMLGLAPFMVDIYRRCGWLTNWKLHRFVSVLHRVFVHLDTVEFYAPLHFLFEVID
jgi:hypothetical protein